MSYAYDDTPPRRRIVRRDPDFSPYWLVILFVGTFFLGMFLESRLKLFGRPRGSGRDPEADSRPVVDRGPLWTEESRVVALYERAKKSAVAVYAYADGAPTSSGSGFVWDKEGRIVTNEHVVRGRTSFKVTLSDQTRASARLIDSFPEKDIAVLFLLEEVPQDVLVPIDIGESRSLKVGQAAFAIGGPYGLEQTLTSGIVSATGRQIKTDWGTVIKDVIQTDAAINKGNSGGPLLDSAGRLIGMNTAIYSESGGSVGIGFAIPVDEINKIVPKLIRGETIKRPRLGVGFFDTAQTRRSGLPGLVVSEVFRGSPASRAGLRAAEEGELGDILLEADGEKLNQVQDLLGILSSKEAGDEIKLTILRDRKRMEIIVKLE